MTDYAGLQQAGSASPVPTTCRSIAWYSPGQSRTVEVAGIRITVRFVGRKGRRGRIAIEAGMADNACPTSTQVARTPQKT